MLQIGKWTSGVWRVGWMGRVERSLGQWDLWLCLNHCHWPPCLFVWRGDFVNTKSLWSLHFAFCFCLLLQLHCFRSYTHVLCFVIKFPNTLFCPTITTSVNLEILFWKWFLEYIKLQHNPSYKSQCRFSEDSHCNLSSERAYYLCFYPPKRLWRNVIVGLRCCSTLLDCPRFTWSFQGTILSGWASVLNTHSSKGMTVVGEKRR